MTNALISDNPVRRATVHAFTCNMAKLKHLGIQPVCGELEKDVLSLPHAMWMCETALKGLQAGEPLDKYSRWLGFVQAVLAHLAVITVAQERTSTRAAFHQAYLAMDIPIPPSKGPTDAPNAGVQAPSAPVLKLVESTPALSIAEAARAAAAIESLYQSKLLTRSTLSSRLQGARELEARGRFGVRVENALQVIRDSAKAAVELVNEDMHAVGQQRFEIIMAFARTLDPNAQWHAASKVGAICMTLPVIDKYHDEEFFVTGFSAFSFDDNGEFRRCSVGLVNKAGNSYTTESIESKNGKYYLRYDDCMY